MLIGGDQKMILYNDMEPTEKIKIYDTGYKHINDEDKKRVLVDYRTGDIHVPKLNTTEALWEMANDFITCIHEKKQPKSSGNIGLDVMKILEASNKSIKNKGCEVVLDGIDRSIEKKQTQVFN
jgi:predicted dehydrogenase